MHQVNRNSEMLHEIDTKVFIINSTIQCLIWHLMLCNMNQTYYTTFKLEYLEYILPCIPCMEIPILYLNT